MSGEMIAYASETMAFGSISTEGDVSKIPLKSVHICGEVHGLLFSSTMTQTYMNEDTEAHEVIYTFPIAWNTALLGIAATIGERRLTGQVLENKQAEDHYEKALSEGNSAILVQQSAKGLCTLNLGNIKAGERIAIEIRCAKLLGFEGKRVRLCIPTVISERYGDEHISGGLASHETATVSSQARYLFTLEIKLFGEIARAKVSCPSHHIEAQRKDDCLVFSLSRNAFLDRDFVLLAEDIPGHSLACATTVGDETMLVASFAPEMPAQSLPLVLKILVDCSGSMQGTRIALAKKGLEQVIDTLAEEDRVSFSRFGFRTLCETHGVIPCTAEKIAHLKGLVQRTQADLGGTEMESALRQTFRIPVPEEYVSAILLITDGDIWNVEGVIASSRESGERIFAIGVGDAPAESLLREMAEQTGGACEFVTGNEDIGEAVLRMFGKMHCARAENIHVSWQQEISWQSKMPRFLYNGETIHCFAVTGTTYPRTVPVLQWQTAAKAHTEAADQLEELASADLFRLGKYRQMQESSSREEQKAIALAQQLLSDQTSLFLLIDRSEAEKVHERAQVQQVPQMLAHGHGSFLQSAIGSMKAMFGDYSAGMAVRAGEDGCPCPMDEPTDPSELSDDDNRIDTLVAAFRSIWHDNLAKMQSVEACLQELRANGAYQDILQRMKDVARSTQLSEEQVCCLVMLYILEYGGNVVDRHSKRLIHSYLKDIGEDIRNGVKQKAQEILLCVESSYPLEQDSF